MAAPGLGSRRPRRPPTLPGLVAKDGRHALMVDGAPFLMLGVQANNAANYPSQLPKVWPAVKAMHASTLEMPVAWEQIEPVEGQFDFSFVDVLIKQARENDVKLVLLWFATWKNNGPAIRARMGQAGRQALPRVITRQGRDAQLAVAALPRHGGSRQEGLRRPDAPPQGGRS